MSLCAQFRKQSKYQEVVEEMKANGFDVVLTTIIQVRS